ncbi:TRAP transporter small permease subunit [bacterium]|nr:TRAP transporter small permease subunit [bacterium]
MGTIISTMTVGEVDFQSVNAFRSQAAWFVFGPITAIGAILVYYMYKASPFLDRHLERSIVVYTYIIIAGIIFVGVLQRFLPFLPGQPPWSTTLPPMLFMVMAWFGCSFNVRLRTHLSFAEFRTKMNPKMQIAMLWLDAILWFGFCVIVVTTTSRVTANAVSNFMIVPGTNSLMQWWFIITVPVAFVLMAGRVLENLIEDIGKYRRGETLIEQAVIGGDV